ncbi:hypothetical protein N431DRAFT_235725 [Stipitochalara longipes BDJ]|nr:hypothetical protein N431DRAFT_235725 [Stipitochalara longipes BDJ]
MAAPPPSTASVSRVTKKGRKLTYCLTVIQQPERARACGSGAKSSADRRPVDPPPVVELRIFQGEGKDQEDITFSYNANFFLFATLEVSRVIAPHRGLPQPPSPQVPVLTGMPVSGMAYLDRPTEAGYFIFPDLSVRHEGKYRLSFNLYEETKEDGDKDGDAGSMSDSKSKISTAASAPDSSFDWRLEVKSAQFTVFSAKKFPGLAESTVLSRTVAEQGCRVRIRRDVRMRRREGKSGGDFDDVAEDDYARPGRAAEQSHDPYRERTHSGSPDGRAPYPDHQRRQSAEYQQSYPQYTPSPLQGHAPPPPGGHLGFLGRDAGPQQYGAPPQPHFAQPPPPPPQAPQSYQAAPNAYPPPSSAQFRGPPPPPQTSLPYDGRQYPQSAHPTNPPREPRENFDEYRRASAPYPSAQAPTGSQFPAVDPGFSRPPYHGYAPQPQSPRTPATLPPLQLHRGDYDGLTSPSGPLSSVNRDCSAFA